MVAWISGMLAVSDGLVIGQWVYNAMMTVGMAYVIRKQNRIERLEDALSARAEELVETQIQVHVAMLKGLIQPIAAELAGCVERLQKGDGEFKDLVGSDHRLELKFTERVAEMRDDLKDFIRENCAMKGDCASSSQVESLSRDVEAIKKQIVALPTAVEQKRRNG